MAADGNGGRDSGIAGMFEPMIPPEEDQDPTDASPIRPGRGDEETQGGGGKMLLLLLLLLLMFFWRFFVVVGVIFAVVVVLIRIGSWVVNAAVCLFACLLVCLFFRFHCGYFSYFSCYC
jgi:hypothetical protein